MNNLKPALLLGFIFTLPMDSPPALAGHASTKEDACQAFERLRADYGKSLGEDGTGKPMATDQSVSVAWALIGAAEDCLAERGVPFERIATYTLRISPDADREPGKTAALLQDMTDGAVIYDVGFFLRKPYAAGGFAQNILYLPHSAVLGQIDMVTRHELNHARAHQLELDEDLRLRHLWIFGEDTMWVDEVLAYADGGLNQANAENLRAWSFDMAEQYLAATRNLIEAPQAEVATSMEGKRCPMAPALREEVRVMLNCIEGVLQSENAQPTAVAACDGPRTQAVLCAP